MDWFLYALDYLLGAPILGLGTMVGFVWKALLLLVTLLVFTAYVLLADRKIWAAVQIRRGPNVVGAFGLLQSFADLLKFVFKEPVIGGAEKPVPLAPLITVLLALPRGLWCPWPRLGAGRHQYWHSLYLRDFSLSVYASSGAGRRTRNIRSSARCAQRRRWSATKSPSASSSSPCCCAWFAQPHPRPRSIGWGSPHAGRAVADLPQLVLLPLFPMFVIFFISALAETTARPSTARADPNWSRVQVEYGSTPYMMFMLGEYVAII